MPFQFTLPTTSLFLFSSSFASGSHPSLLLAASKYRGVLRESLKKHKRLPPQSKSADLVTVLQALESYLPYLTAVDAGLSNQKVGGEDIDVILQSTPSISWRLVLLSAPIPGRELPRLRVKSFEFELYFVLSTLAVTNVNLSRAALLPLYSSGAAAPSGEQRTVAITSAIKNLLVAASIYSYLKSRSETLAYPSPSPEIDTATFDGLRALAHAEATLLAVLKDDPYPTAVAQERNQTDKEWMIKAPDMPKVRAHLFARLCLAASEHAESATAVLNMSGKVNDELRKYVLDLRQVGRGRACRFFGIDAELGGQAGQAIAWLRAAKAELGSGGASEETGKKSSFSKLKQDWSDRRGEKKLDSDKSWGADAGRAEELRVLNMLDAKWSKMNDTMNTQKVPPIGPLLTTMPSGRDVHVIKPYIPPELNVHTLESLRLPPSPNGEGYLHDHDDSDDDVATGREVIGAFPGTKGSYTGSRDYF